MASLHRLIFRRSHTLPSKHFQHGLLFPRLRKVSTTSPPKPRLLEKPERFNPPSHPSRLRSKPRYLGPELKEHERQAQRTRRYPNMMPPEGSFLHWFLTDRSVHLYITLGILVSLTVFVWYQDFIFSTPYKELLPPNSLIFSHPLTFFTRWGEVYSMHVRYVSAQTAEKRRQKVDDVKKRSHYRKAHGLDQENGLFGAWAATEDAADTALKEGEAPVAAADVADASPVPVERDNVRDGTYLDFEGKRQPAPRKKWLGIW